MEEYTNRELALLLENIERGIKGMHERQDRTNGSIGKNRSMIEINSNRLGKLENWRWYIGGGLSVIIVFILPILFLLIKHILDQGG